MNPLHLARQIWKKFHYFFTYPLIRPTVAKRGRPCISIKKVFFGIVYLFWSGCSWRALPRCYGTRSTVHRYFSKWANTKVFLKIWKIILDLLKHSKKLKTKIQIIDCSEFLVQYMSKKKAFLSRKHKAKRTIKLSLLIDSNGIPLSTILSTPNIHDTNLLHKTLLKKLILTKKDVKNKLLADSGYIGPRQEKTAVNYGYKPLFCQRYYHRHKLTFYQKRILEQNRWKVEQAISQIKKFRRLKVCYERLFLNFKAFIDLASCFIAFRKLYF